MRKRYKKPTLGSVKRRTKIEFAPDLNDTSAWGNAPGLKQKMAKGEKILKKITLPK